MSFATVAMDGPWPPPPHYTYPPSIPSILIHPAHLKFRRNSLSMASRRPSPSSQSSAPPPPTDRNERRNRRQPSYYNQNNQARYSNGGGGGGGAPNRRRSYSYPQEGKRAGGGYGGGRDGSRVTIVLCVFRGASSGFVTTPVTFDRNRTTDEELWGDIRDAFRNELEKPWRRVFLFKHLRIIRPIEFSRNDVPKRLGAGDGSGGGGNDPVPGEHEFMHAYRHPERLRTPHAWVDWFVAFRKDPDKTYGLEFVEGLWADKLAFIAIVFTIAIIVVSIVWCVMGGVLQTVFTVMGFVLTGVAGKIHAYVWTESTLTNRTAEIALVALYYQVSLPG